MVLIKNYEFVAALGKPEC